MIVGPTRSRKSGARPRAGTSSPPATACDVFRSRETNRSPVRIEKGKIIMHTTSPVPGTLVGIATLVEMLQRSRASIYRDIARGAFPKAVKLGHSSRWLVSEVEAYIQTLSERRK
jgi:predicted DNA-binding transcriptional regulator AlpA